MATKQFELSWLGVYKASGNSYSGGNNIQVGSNSAYNSYLGIPSAVRTALKTSRTTPKLSIKFNVTNADAEFDFGAHKETANKASGTMPWYTYIGLHPVYGSTGWKTVDLTDAFMNAYIKGTYQGIVMYGNTSTGYGVAYGRNAGSNNAYFEVTGTWNTPPTEPEITAPDNTTVANTSLQVKWKASTDPETDQSKLTYQLRYYDGSKIANTWDLGENVLSYTIPMSSYPETSSAYVEVRAFDGEDYSDWVRSEKFSVVKNLPPKMPTNLSPSGGQYYENNTPIRFTWSHNDDGAQSAFKLSWRLRSTNPNETINTSGWVNSQSQHYDYFAGFPVGDYEWWVQTRDVQGLESPESAKARFSTKAPTKTPTIITPQEGNYGTNRVELSWNALDQNSYELQVLQGDNVVFEEVRYTFEKSRAIPYTLTNNTTYTIRVRVADYTGLYSDWGTVTITTDFTPPAKPVVTLDIDNDAGSIVVLWETTPSGNPQEPPVSYTEVFRRPYNASEEQPWQLIGENQQPNDSLIDYTPASGTMYQYRVVNYAENETSSQGDIAEGQVVFEHAFLHRTRALTDILQIVSGDSRDQDIDLQGHAMYFSNRRLPIYEFGFSVENKLDLSWVVDTKENYRLALQFLTRKETFLYRDNNGRRFYCIVSNPKVSDQQVDGFTFTVQLLEVDYQEGGIA